MNVFYTYEFFHQFFHISGMLISNTDLNRMSVCVTPLYRFIHPI
jgi:hypothetical protein